ncbi:HAD-like domain-containing protein [Lophiotrema nucula]|uniref:Mitochondrial import inner membrane translocase subunit TIM50 n=1 Tax=Lophiotrema nucula TaxID=690887 RepID=A0A6A5ZIZ7_9PLEO|nr:HAD-like domain-containing protein [Lophiotrema nucula]
MSLNQTERYLPHTQSWATTTNTLETGTPPPKATMNDDDPPRDREPSRERIHSDSFQPNAPQQHVWPQNGQQQFGFPAFQSFAAYQQQAWMMAHFNAWQAYYASGAVQQPFHNTYGAVPGGFPASGNWNPPASAPPNPLEGFRPQDPGHQTTSNAPAHVPAKKSKPKGIPKDKKTTSSAQKHSSPKIPMPAPKPTDDYLAQSAQDNYVIDPPERMLVILDLNGTLIYRPNRHRPTHMIARPFLKPFLAYLFENFAVMVWSSARPENVKVLVNNALDHTLRDKLVAYWGRNSFKLAPEHYSQNVQVYKDLKLIWEDDTVQKHHPKYSSGGRFNQRNTILIDDTSLKAAAQPFNLLEIPEFEGLEEDPNPEVLREVAGYLEVLRMQHDVSRFIRIQPFHDDGRWQYDWEDDMAGGGVLLPQD